MAEAKIKTAVAYAFSNAHRAPEAYLLQSNYCDENEFSAAGKDGANYAQEIAGLTSVLGRRTSKSKSDFIVHYRNAYGAVPIWVLVNDLTFGNIEHFFNLMRPKEKSAVCKMIVDSTGRTGSRKLGFSVWMTRGFRLRSSLNSVMFAPMMRDFIAPRLADVKR